MIHNTLEPPQAFLQQPTTQFSGSAAAPGLPVDATCSAIPWWGHIGLLWLMLAPLCVVIFTLCQPISPHDFWWHVRAGGVIAETGRIPTTNIFSWSLPSDTPYLYQNWASQLLLYKILQWGGIAWIVVVRSACVGVAYVLITVAAYRRALRAMKSFSPTLVGAADEQNSSSAISADNRASVRHDIVAARLVALSTLLAFGMSAFNIDARPQMFSLPLFALFVFVVFEWPYWFASDTTSSTATKGRFARSPDKAAGRLTWSGSIPRPAAWGMALLIAATAAWANLHGAFFIGPLLLATAYCGEVVQAYLHARGIGRFFGSPLPATGRRALGLLAVLCTAAAMLNPRGAQLYLYVAHMATNHTIQKFIVEWQPPAFGDWNSAIFLVSPLILMAIVAIMWAKRATAKSATPAASPHGELSGCAWNVCGCYGFRLAELLVLALLMVMGMRNLRSIIWYAFFLSPILSACCAQALLMTQMRRAKRQSTRQNTSSTLTESVKQQPEVPATSRVTWALNVFLATSLLVLILPVLPWFKSALPWPAAYRARFAPTPQGVFPSGFSGDPPLLLDRSTPVEAVYYLRRNPPRRRLWNDMGCGSYLIWAIYPAIPPALDPRIELYPAEFWMRYLKLCTGPIDAALTLQRQDVSDALLDREAQPSLIARLRVTPGWREIPLSGGPAVLMRHTGRNETLRQQD